jgi:hypothetical protein
LGKLKPKFYFGVANNFSLLDALHLVAMSWNRVSEKIIENCFRKDRFSKTNAGIQASEESVLTSEIFDHAPDGMPKEEFKKWLDVDNNAEVVAAMKVSVIKVSFGEWYHNKKIPYKEINYIGL